MTAPAHGAPDPDLVSFVQLANAFGLEQHLVLTLPGLVLEGTLIGAHTHFHEVAQLLQGEDPEGTLRSDLAARFRRREKDYADWGAGSKLGDLDPDGPQGEDLSAMPELQHLHLRGVSVLSPASDRVLPLWRGRLSDVVGWTVGEPSEAEARPTHS
jgi:hypothetical protein